MTQPALTGFDWSTLDPETRAIVQDTTARLHDLERRTGEAIIQIGRGLIDTKHRLPHGQFLDWMHAEFGWSVRTAQNFMRVAECFDGEDAIIAHSGPTALIALASGSTPQDIRDEFAARAEAGETIRHKDVKRRLATVDRDTGEFVDDEPVVDAEVVDPSDAMSFLPEPLLESPAPQPVTVDAIAQKNPAVDRARMLRLYTSGISHASNNLLPLKPAAIVASFRPDHGDDIGARRFIATMREWCDELESEMRRGIRVIHRKEA